MRLLNINEPSAIYIFFECQYFYSSILRSNQNLCIWDKNIHNRYFQSCAILKMNSDLHDTASFLFKKNPLINSTEFEVFHR